MKYGTIIGLLGLGTVAIIAAIVTGNKKQKVNGGTFVYDPETKSFKMEES